MKREDQDYTVRALSLINTNLKELNRELTAEYMIETFNNLAYETKSEVINKTTILVEEPDGIDNDEFIKRYDHILKTIIVSKCSLTELSSDELKYYFDIIHQSENTFKIILKNPM